MEICLEHRAFPGIPLAKVALVCSSLLCGQEAVGLCEVAVWELFKEMYLLSERDADGKSVIRVVEC